MIEQMKKFIHIFYIALLAVACVDPLEQIVPINNEPEDGAKVTLEFSLPPITKSSTMAHDPEISTIHVAVFNEAGILKQYEEATLTNPGKVTNGNNPNGNPTYSVEVNMSATKRILHFIADSPIDNYEDLISLAGTSGEDVILNALSTDGGETAYWQRIELDKIDAYTYQGNTYTTPDGITWGSNGATSYFYDDDHGHITVYKGDYIKRDGHKVLDGTGYFQSSYVAGMIANIPLVRNFAEITVSQAASTNFIPQQFALVNVPIAGYVAPFDTKKREFASAYINAGTTALTHSVVSDSQYPGSLVGSIDPSMPSSFIDLTATGQSAVKTAYMYERTVPNTSQPATCILVGGLFDADGDNSYNDADDPAARGTDGKTWFKIEIADPNGGYFPIYRGLSYDIEIGAITGTNGYATAEAAFHADPIGDVSGSVTTATLEQISDGKGTTLWVEYIDYVATQPETKTLFYTMYYQNPSTGVITYLYDTITITDESVSHPDESYKAITTTPVIDDNVYTGTGAGTPDNTKEWKKATVNLVSSGNTTTTHTTHSVLRIEGTATETTNKPMHRDIHYRVMGTQNFQNGDNILKATALATENAEETTTLTIYLPSDLGYSLFPITLMIEAQNGNFNTTEGLPVESGPSLFGNNKNAFYFLKTIEYDDYYDASTGAYTTAFTAEFKTTRKGTAAHTNATTFAVLDKVKSGRTTPYFNMATCEVTIEGASPIFQLSTNAITVNADVTTATFVVRSTTGGEWSLTTNNSDVTVTPASGTGNKTVNVSFPANTSTSSATYIITASLEGFDSQYYTITQRKKVTYETVTRTIATTTSTIGSDYVYGGTGTNSTNTPYTSELGITFTGGSSRQNNHIRFNNNNSPGVTVTANTITSIVITWTETNRAGDNTSVTSGGGNVSYSNTGNYPTTTWTSTSGSDSVSLSFATSNTQNMRVREIAVTYLVETQ